MDYVPYQQPSAYVQRMNTEENKRIEKNGTEPKRRQILDKKQKQAKAKAAANNNVHFNEHNVHDLAPSQTNVQGSANPNYSMGNARESQSTDRARTSERTTLEMKAQQADNQRKRIAVNLSFSEEEMSNALGIVLQPTQHNFDTKRLMHIGTPEKLGGDGSGDRGERTPTKLKLVDVFSQRNVLNYLKGLDSWYGFLELDASGLWGSKRFSDINDKTHSEFDTVLNGRLYLPLSKLFALDLNGGAGYSGHNQELGKQNVERYSQISTNLDAAVLLALKELMLRAGVRLGTENYQELNGGITPMFGDDKDDAAKSAWNAGGFIGAAVDLNWLQASLDAGLSQGKAVFDASGPTGETLTAVRNAYFAQLKARCQTEKELLGFIENAYLCVNFGIEYAVDNYNMLHLKQKTLQTSGSVLAGAGVIDLWGDDKADIGVRLGVGFETNQSKGDRFDYDRTTWGPKLEVPIDLGKGVTLVPYVEHKQLGGHDDNGVGIALNISK